MSLLFADPQVAELNSVNTALAQCLRLEPAQLSFGAMYAQADPLVVCGILGGKDVGKTTLINALARANVSRDEGEVSRGTSCPIAYVHEDAVDALRTRLGAADAHNLLSVTAHRADAIRNVVLVDLPDFDSEFVDHVRLVRAVTPLLDRVIWVQTPRKIGDRAWVAILDDVVKDSGNVHVVLNKLDELLADDRAPDEPQAPSTAGPRALRRGEEFWRAQAAWFERTVAEAGCPSDEQHRFLVAAAFPDQSSFVDRVAHVWDDPEWRRYPGDRAWVEAVGDKAERELDRLRERVLGPVSVAQGDLLKTANRACELHDAHRRIRTHYDLDHLLGQLDSACDPHYHESLLREAVDDDWYGQALQDVETRRATDTRLADYVLEARVQQWPLLRLVYWPFGWLSRLLGRQIEHQMTAAAPPESAPGGALSYSEIAVRVEFIRSRLLADCASTLRALHLQEQIPPSSRIVHRLTATIDALPARLDTTLRDAVHRRDRRPSVMARAALWLVFLWFPLFQPVTAGLLEIYTQESGWATAHGAYRVVAALSAVNLLAGFAVVAAIFVLLLAAMYARAVRGVRRTRARTVGEGNDVSTALDEALKQELLDPLVRPLQDRLALIKGLAGRLDRSAEGNQSGDATAAPAISR